MKTARRPCADSWSVMAMLSPASAASLLRICRTASGAAPGFRSPPDIHLAEHRALAAVGDVERGLGRRSSLASSASSLQTGLPQSSSSSGSASCMDHIRKLLTRLGQSRPMKANLDKSFGCQAAWGRTGIGRPYSQSARREDEELDHRYA